MGPMSLRALILDFDGTLVDSEGLHERALREAVSALGLDVPPGRYIGLPDRDALADVLLSAGREPSESVLAALLEQKTAAAKRLWTLGAAPAYPGAVELARGAKAAGWKVAVCTAALREECEPVLEHIGITPLLDAFTTADDVSRSKPDPSCYTLTADRLGVRAGACVAIEDSHAGVRAAAGAGCRVIGVGHTTARERLEAAHLHVGRIGEVTIARMISLLEEHG